MSWKHRIVLIALLPLLALGVSIAALRYLTCIVTNVAKAWSIALLVDQLANVSLNGRVDQSISYRAAVAARAGKRWGLLICKLLNDVQPGHCAKALESGK